MCNWLAKLFGCKCQCHCGKDKEMASAPNKPATPAASNAGTTAGQPENVEKNQ